MLIGTLFSPALQWGSLFFFSLPVPYPLALRGKVLL